MILLKEQKELLNNITRNTNFLFGTGTIQTARNYQNISGHLKTTTPILQLTGVFGLQQQKKAVPPVPHRKTLLS